MKSDALQNHILATYVNLRIGIAVIGIVFPVLLFVGGKWLGIALQDSMSDYYNQCTADGRSMRDVFVGILFALGVFLWLYKGYTARENIALNFAGAFAVGVAMFPTDGGNCGAFQLKPVHITCAVSFFLAIAYVCIWCAKDTLMLIDDAVSRQRYRYTYHCIGAVMIATPVIAVLLALIFDQFKSYVYFVELAGVWAFGSYWIVKSNELKRSAAERRAVRAELDLDALGS